MIFDQNAQRIARLFSEVLLNDALTAQVEHVLVSMWSCIMGNLWRGPVVSRMMKVVFSSTSFAIM